MKKKMIFALLLAGMSFATPNVADAQGTAKVAGGDGWRIYVSWGDFEACFGSGHTCWPVDIVVSPI